ncbi:MAG: hypothetical protein LBH59_05355 [Planctomycetaceae bacterium]|jgi:hypothetical protein|nr:hypothetical protein [Planctomycetaceae bacterium]
MKKSILTSLFLLLLPVGIQAQETVLIEDSEQVELQTIDPEFIDPAFERFVDMEMLAFGWSNLDARILTDCGFQLAEGERVLSRSHQKLTSKAVLETAIKVATDQHDTETVDRILNFATSRNNTELAAKASTAKKLAGTERSIAPTLMINAFSAPLSKILICKEIVSVADKAKLTGDKELLLSLVEAIPASAELKEELSEQERQSLKAYVEAGLKNVAELDEADAETSNALDKLSGESRAGKYGKPSYGGNNYKPPVQAQKIKPGEVAAIAGIAIGAAVLQNAINNSHGNYHHHKPNYHHYGYDHRPHRPPHHYYPHRPPHYNPHIPYYNPHHKPHSSNHYYYYK